MVVNVNFWIDEPVLAFMIVFMPVLLMWGMWSLANWFTSFIKVRQGYFSVNWIMKNHQWKERMMKPDGNDVKIEGKPQPFLNSPNYTAFRGSKKMVFFSRIGDRLRQLQIKADTDKDLDKNKGIPPETEFNDMLDGAEMAGSIFGLKKSQFEKILLIIAMCAAAGALVFSMMNLGNINSLSTQVSGLQNTTNAINSTLGNLATPITHGGVPPNATVISG